MLCHSNIVLPMTLHHSNASRLSVVAVEFVFAALSAVLALFISVEAGLGYGGMVHVREVRSTNLTVETRPMSYIDNEGRKDLDLSHIAPRDPTVCSGSWCFIKPGQDRDRVCAAL